MIREVAGALGGDIDGFMIIVDKQDHTDGAPMITYGRLVSFDKTIQFTIVAEPGQFENCSMGEDIRSAFSEAIKRGESKIALQYA
jgi:hypothetical protein